MLKVDALQNFIKYKNPPNAVVEEIVTDATPKMKEVAVTVNNLEKTKMNVVPKSIVQMVDKATQTVPVSDDE